MRKHYFQTRRDFLRTTLLGGAFAYTVPSFLQLTMQSLHAEAAHSVLQHKTGKDHPILVVIQLAGGNDGLNTIVPWRNDHYYRARPSLGIPQDQVMKINHDIGMHPALADLARVYESGNLAIIQGVGYPNPNRSHFRSMEIWHTASDSDRFEQHGWIGRYFDHACQGMDASVGIHVTPSPPQAFQASRPKGVALEVGRASRQRPRSSMMEMDGEDEDDVFSGASIDMLNGGGRHAAGEDPLDFLERTALDARVSAEQISAIMRNQPEPSGYPGGGLARDLRQVSRLIAGGMSTRIYYVSQGGYDTHVGQAGTHNRLLGELGGAMRAFVEDLKRQGNLDRVLVMTFSEFGRRMQENANQGTDHGAAAPLFLAGGGVPPGVFGRTPSLAPRDLQRGDPVHTTDFRSVYATVLEGHLGVEHEPILRRRYPFLRFA